ncbi:hypothetical protein L9F63_017965, partial [Diploptera punctata]
PDIIRTVKSRRLRWAGHVARMENEKSAWKLLVGKPDGKRPLDRPRMRWENNISYDLREPDIMRTVKSRRLRWAGHVARMENEKSAWKLLVGKPEGKRPLDRPRMRWENNINYDLREVDYTGNDWKALAHDRDVWRTYVRAAMNLRVR